MPTSSHRGSGQPSRHVAERGGGGFKTRKCLALGCVFSGILLPLLLPSVLVLVLLLRNLMSGILRVRVHTLSPAP